jgi:hypothetical protein
VGDVDAFLGGPYAAEPHLRRTGDPAAFADLLSLAAVDAQLSGAGLRRPAIRMVRDGEVLAPSAYTRRARSGSVWIDDLVDPAKALGELAAGATIVLQSLHRWWPPITGFCRDLESALGHPVQANAYLTPAGAAGFAPHHDTHDVFVLQVHGSKHWTVREPLLDAPLGRHTSTKEEAAAQPVVLDLELEAGDCLYLPRGAIHSATAQDEVSLHLTVGVLAETRHDLVRRLVDRTAELPAFRRPLPVDHAADAGSATRVVKEVVADLLAWLEELDASAVAGEHVERIAHRRAPLLDGQLLDLAALDRLADTTPVRRRDGVVWRLDPGGTDSPDRVVLVLRDRRIDLPAAVEPALRRLLDGEARAAEALADLMDEDSRLVLVRRLVREGVLRTAGS